MSKYASKVIAIAEAEDGYLEKASNKNLDDKTANAGKANYTKYARDLDNIPGFYNGKKNGYPWCDVFADWCFVKAFGVEEAKKLLCQPSKSFGAGCAYSANYYKAKGQFHTKNPKPGDQIFFYNSSKTRVSHTGIVRKVDSSKVYTVEGNTSGASGVVANGGGVCKKVYPLNYYRIYGYGRPAYDEEKEEATVNIELNVLRKGSEGEQVEALQRLLSTHGYNLGSKNPFDGDFGSKTDAAVKAYQKAKGLTVDGIVGAETWGSLLK